MKQAFYKYQGTGNDFVIIDNRSLQFPKHNEALIVAMCDRRFGIGADGLILLENHSEVDFKMVYFNADGKEGSMCGNGGRCIVHFAHYLQIFKSNTQFEAIDGLHQATINQDLVSLKMNDVTSINTENNFIFLDTGSPHHVEMVNDLDNYRVYEIGADKRCTIYGEQGANINFVEPIDNSTFSVRTYERGVEAETLSCGTGVTAVAIAMYETEQTQNNLVNLQTKGGMLQVHFQKKGKHYKDIFLEGPAKQVFKGVWE